MRPLQVICSVARPEEKALYERAKTHGFDSEIVLVDKATFPGPAIPASAPGATGQSVALMRTASFFAAGQIASVLEAEDKALFNKSDTIALFGQKVQTDAWLRAHGFPTIPSVLAYSEKSALSAAELIGYPLVVKPSIGGFGKLVQVIRDEEELRNVCEYVLGFAPASHKSFYLQKHVDIEFDIRAVTIGDTCVASYNRILAEGASGHGPRNVAQGAIGENYTLDPKHVAMLERLAREAGSDFLGVDLLISTEGEEFICDVNPVCRFQEATRVTGVDIADCLLDYVAQCA